MWKACFSVPTVAVLWILFLCLSPVRGRRFKSFLSLCGILSPSDGSAITLILAVTPTVTSNQTLKLDCRPSVSFEDTGGEAACLSSTRDPSEKEAGEGERGFLFSASQARVPFRFRAMDETDPCLYKEKTSVLSDPAVIARRKRMEIRRFKKLSCSTQPVHNDPHPRQSGFLKRARPPPSSNAFCDFCKPLQEDSTPFLKAKTEEGSNLPLASQLSTQSRDKEVDIIPPPDSAFPSDAGGVRSKSSPPERWQTSKCCFHISESSHGSRGVGVEGHFVTVLKNVQPDCLLPSFLEDHRVDFSSLDAALVFSTSPQKGLTTMVEVTEQLKKESSGSKVQNFFSAAEQGSEPSQVVFALEKECSKSKVQDFFSAAEQSSEPSQVVFALEKESSKSKVQNFFSAAEQSSEPSQAVFALEKESSESEVQNFFSAAEQSSEPSQVVLQSVTDQAQLLEGAVGCKGDTEMVEPVGKFAAIPVINGVFPSPSQSKPSSSHSLIDGKCPPSGKLLVCGRRREMEDTATIVPSFTQLRCDVAEGCLCDGNMEDRPPCDLHFFAVYDGHGGCQASDYCVERLHHVLAEELSNLSNSKDVNDEPSDWSSFKWEKAMTSCFSKMDKEVGGVCPNGQCDDVDSSANCCVDSIAPENVGTTAVVAVVSSCQIVVANCGDSRAVLSRGGKAISLSTDHKPERDDESSRIETAGGRVIYWDGYRVGGLLALSRAIGDRYLKRYVVSQPEVTCLQRTEEDECLILASDGLWDVISNDTACEIARRCLTSARKKFESGTFALGEDPASASVAALLVKLAYGRGSKDNISVVVVDLKARHNHPL